MSYFPHLCPQKHPSFCPLKLLSTLPDIRAHLLNRRVFYFLNHFSQLIQAYLLFPLLLHIPQFFCHVRTHFICCTDALQKWGPDIVILNHYSVPCFRSSHPKSSFFLKAPLSNHLI